MRNTFLLKENKMRKAHQQWHTFSLYMSSAHHTSPCVTMETITVKLCVFNSLSFLFLVTQSFYLPSTVPSMNIRTLIYILYICLCVCVYNIKPVVCLQLFAVHESRVFL